MSENAEDLDEGERGQWARHYDILLWSVTTIFAGAIGGLLVYVHSNFNIRLAVFGLIITPITVYFGASFRELCSKSMSESAKRLIQRGRKLYQWEVYVAVFVLLELLWGALLISDESFKYASCYMTDLCNFLTRHGLKLYFISVVLAVVISVGVTIRFGCLGLQERRRNQSSTEKKKKYGAASK